MVEEEDLFNRVGHLCGHSCLRMETSPRSSLLTNVRSFLKLQSLSSFLGPVVWPFLLEDRDDWVKLVDERSPSVGFPSFGLFLGPVVRSLLCENGDEPLVKFISECSLSFEALFALFT